MKTDLIMSIKMLAKERIEGLYHQKPYEANSEIAPETINPYCYTDSDVDKLKICLEEDGFDRRETVCDTEDYNSSELKQFQQDSTKQNNYPPMFPKTEDFSLQTEDVFFFDKIQRTENLILPFF